MPSAAPPTRGPSCPRPNPSGRRAAWWLAAAAFTLIGLVWTRPLHRYAFQGIPYEVEPAPEVALVRLAPHDSLQLYYRYWLARESLTGRLAPFANPYEFALPGARGFTSQQFPVSLLFAVLSVISPIFAYNAIVWLSFTACGLGMMLLAYRFTRDRAAAAIAGMLFAVMPFRLPQLYAGHPNGIAVAFLPFALLASEAALDRGRRNRSVAAMAFGAGLCFSSIALLDMQLAFFAGILLAGYAGVRALGVALPPRYSLAHRPAGQSLRWLAGLAGGTLPGLVYLAVMKYVVLSRSALHAGGAVAPGVVARLGDLMDVTVAGEQRIYIGPWVLLLTVAGALLPWVTWRGRRRAVRGRIALGWSVVAGVGLLLSLAYAPELVAWTGRIPILRLSRTPARAIVITFTAAGVLSAGALASLRALLARRGRRGGWIWVYGLFAVLILWDYRLRGPRGINLLPRESPAFAAAVAEDPEARILAVPLWPGESAWSAHLLYHVTLSRARIVNGYSPVATAAYRDRVFLPLQVVNVGQFGAEEWARVRGLGVTHVTFHPEAFPAPQWVSVFPAGVTRAALMQSPYLDWVRHADPIDLFRVRAAPAARPALAISSPIGITLTAAGGMGAAASRRADDGAAVSGRVLETVNREPHAVCAFFDRGRVYPPGRYRVALRAMGAATADDGAARAAPLRGVTLRAVDTSTGLALAERRIDGAAGPAAARFDAYPFAFELPHAARVRFEAWIEPGAGLRVDMWHMTFADRRPFERVEAEDCFHVGRVVAEAGASGRGYVQTDARDPHRNMVRGPYRFLEPGAYRVRARLRSRPGPSGAPAEIEIASRIRPDVPAWSMLAAATLPTAADAPADFFETVVPFMVPAPGAIVEWNLHRAPDARLDVDWLAIEPADPTPAAGR